MAQARELADERMKSLTIDRWVNSSRSGDFYTTGTVAAERIDSDA
jgi:hypothetical protein